MSFIVRNMDFNDRDMLDRVIQNSNVVINLLGARKHRKFLSDFEEPNIQIASRIADACSRNKNIKRLIHFSAAGADINSESLDYRTKYVGE